MPTLAIRDRVKELRRVPARDLLPSPRNWRRHPESQANALRGLLSECGFAGALLVREVDGGQFELIDGHLRAETVPDMLVPVLVLDVDEAEAAKLLATFDPLGTLAEADTAALESLLAEVQTDSPAVRALLDGLAGQYRLEGSNGPPAEDPGPQLDRAAELQAQWGTARGQLWEIPSQTVAGKCHRLLCGDSTDAGDVARLMGGGKADCVFTSPPYAVGVDYGEYEDTIQNLRALLPLVSKRWAEVVLPGGFAVVNFGDIAAGRNVTGTAEPCEYPMALEYWPVFRADGWLLWSRRVWVKPNARVHSPWAIQSNRAATDWEHIWTWKRPGPPVVMRTAESQFGWVDTTHDEGVEVGKETHGAGMALALPCRLLPIHSRSGGLIYEPFVGTGTTVVAAERVGRICYGCELSPAYTAVALQRLQGLGLAPRLIERLSETS